MGTPPTLVDVDLGIAIWKSGAVLTYLLESYDTDYTFRLDPPTAAPKDWADYWHLQQYILATVYPFLASLVVHVILKPPERQDGTYRETAKNTFSGHVWDPA